MNKQQMTPCLNTSEMKGTNDTERGPSTSKQGNIKSYNM